MFGCIKFKKSVNEGGTGIGLSFCKKLCELLKFELSLDSMKGVGTTFTLGMGI